MEFKPVSEKGGYIAMGGAAILAVAGYLLARALVGAVPAPPTFWMTLALLVCVLLAGCLFYLGVSFLRLGYRVDRNGIRVSWWGMKQLIPVESIVRVAEAAAVGRFRGIRWPGAFVGLGEMEGIEGAVRIYATSDPSEGLLIVGEKASYVISPAKPSLFVKAWEERAPLGPTRYWEEGISRTPFLAREIWGDRTALVLGAACVAAWLGLWGYVCWGYGSLSPNGGRAFWYHAVVGLLVTVVDLLLGFYMHDREKLIAYILWGGGIAVQAILLFSLTGLGA